MYEMSTTIVNPSGLHARPASDFVRTAGKYRSKIKISRADRSDRVVNAKSMVMLLSLSATQGVVVSISAEGDDEQEAVTALVEFIRGGLGEGV